MFINTHIYIYIYRVGQKSVCIYIIYIAVSLLLYINDNDIIILMYHNDTHRIHIIYIILTLLIMVLNPILKKQDKVLEITMILLLTHNKS